MHPLVVPAPALPPQPLEQLRKSFLRPPVRQLQKQLDEILVAVRSASIAIHRSSQAHRRTSPTLGQLMLASQLHYQLALDRRPYSFFPASTAFKIAMIWCSLNLLRFILASWVGYPTRKPLLFNGPFFRGTYRSSCSTVDGVSGICISHLSPNAKWRHRNSNLPTLL